MVTKDEKKPNWYAERIQKKEAQLDKYAHVYEPLKLKGCKLDVNAESVYRLGLIHCTANEVAAVLNVNVAVIRHRFMADLLRGHEEGAMSIKRKIHEKALSGAGDTQLLIFLSKQRCGYRDRMPDEAPNLSFTVYVDQVPK